MRLATPSHDLTVSQSMGRVKMRQRHGYRPRVGDVHGWDGSVFAMTSMKWKGRGRDQAFRKQQGKRHDR